MGGRWGFFPHEGTDETEVDYVRADLSDDYRPLFGDGGTGEQPVAGSSRHQRV